MLAEKDKHLYQLSAAIEGHDYLPYYLALMQKICENRRLPVFGQIAENAASKPAGSKKRKNKSSR
jgi:hypothetical protein